MYALKISQDFIHIVGIRKGDYLDYSLLQLKQGGKIITIYPEMERIGYVPYDFNDESEK